MLDVIETEETILKEEWEDRFFDLLSETGMVTKAARGARVARCVVYRRRDERPDFAKRWEEAERLGVEAMEDEARRRALKESDTLLIFLLKSKKPEVYRETIRQQHVGANNGPIEIEAVSAKDRLKAKLAVMVERQADTLEALEEKECSLLPSA